jgi:hypothetical protein
MALGALAFHRERVRDKQRKWIGAQKRASHLQKTSDEEFTKPNTQEAFPMIQPRASLAKARGERPLTVSWG